MKYDKWKRWRKKMFLALATVVGLVLLNIAIWVALPATSILRQLPTLIGVAANIVLIAIYTSFWLCEFAIGDVDFKILLICVSVTTVPPYIVIFIVLPYLYQCLCL